MRWARKGEAELIKKNFCFHPARQCSLLWSLPSPVSRLVPLFCVMLLYYYVVDRRESEENQIGEEERKTLALCDAKFVAKEILFISS